MEYSTNHCTIFYSEHKGDIKTIKNFCEDFGYYFNKLEDVEHLWERFSKELYKEDWVKYPEDYELNLFIEYLVNEQRFPDPKTGEPKFKNCMWRIDAAAEDEKKRKRLEQIDSIVKCKQCVHFGIEGCNQWSFEPCINCSNNYDNCRYSPLAKDNFKQKEEEPYPWLLEYKDKN